jgi:isopenicillin-N N-acyltransferase-like protein
MNIIHSENPYYLPLISTFSTIFVISKKSCDLLKILLKYLSRSLGIFLELFLFGFIFLLLFILLNSVIDAPKFDKVYVGKRTKIAENHYVLDNNYLKKNEYGIWEMYIEGNPSERGLIYGELAKELVQRQEDIFVSQINQLVPSQFFQQFLRLFIGFFNSDLPDYVPLENQQEIYGISKSFSDKYNYIAPKYTRILNYHAAHDIGHALNDYSMVGCTSFALKGDRTEDGNLMIGRNFDFYVGDEFAEDKLLLFMKPTTGHAFVSYSWAGFTGVASGLNDQGLSVTINASKSDLPTGSKMPISLLAREILQYASTIEEALAIAKKRHTFVSETLMIGSTKDNKAILIEKSPKKTGVYDSQENTLICSNHYQSDTFKNTEVNRQNIAESDSKYRYNKVHELLGKQKTFNPTSILEVLRNQYGQNKDTLGMGNPRAINQMIVHHSVVIVPEKSLFYVSTTDFQLGEFVGYDLKKTIQQKSTSIANCLEASPFLETVNYQEFLAFKKTKKRISNYLILNQALNLKDSEIKAFISNNGESYVTYEMLGKYFMKKSNFDKAGAMFSKALTKELASHQVKKELESLLKECKEKK